MTQDRWQSRAFVEDHIDAPEVQKLRAAALGCVAAVPRGKIGRASTALRGFQGGGGGSSFRVYCFGFRVLKVSRLGVGERGRSSFRKYAAGRQFRVLGLLGRIEGGGGCYIIGTGTITPSKEL